MSGETPVPNAGSRSLFTIWSSRNYDGVSFQRDSEPKRGWTFGNGSRKLIVRFTRHPHAGCFLLLVDEQVDDGRADFACGRPKSTRAGGGGMVGPGQIQRGNRDYFGDQRSHGKEPSRQDFPQTRSRKPLRCGGRIAVQLSIWQRRTDRKTFLLRELLRAGTLIIHEARRESAIKNGPESISRSVRRVLLAGFPLAGALVRAGRRPMR